MNRSGLLSGNTTLFAGCIHARPDERPEEWDRHRALGKMALDFRVSAVRLTGDITDYPGGRSWNSAKRQEGKRLLKDRQAGIDAMKEIMSPWRTHVNKHRRQGHIERAHMIDWAIAGGNHDDTEDDIAAQDPKMEGLIGSKFLYDAWREMGVDVWEYKRQILDLEYPEIHGTYYGHFLPSGAMGKATALRSVLNKAHASFVYTHTHEFGLDMKRDISGRFLQALNAGTFQPPSRLKPGNWNGAVILSDMHDGQFQVHQFNYDWIMETYGEAGYAQELRGRREKAERDKQDAAQI